MFKILSLFKRSSDEQLADSHHDFNEMSAPGGVQEMLENKTPVLVENAFNGNQELHPARVTPAIDTTLLEQADQARISDIRDKLKNISVDPSHEVYNDYLLPPDLDLIKGYKERREEKPPGVTHYKNGDRELWFVNTAHVHKGGISEDPTLRTIKEVIDGNDLAFLITEGHMTNMTDERKKDLLEQNRKMAEAGGDMPESGYAAYLANQKSQASQKEVVWVGGEPSGVEFFQRMQEDYGYSREDILAVTVLKQIADGNLRDADFGTQYSDIMQRTADRLDPQHELDLSKTLKDFTFDKFKEWYASQVLPEGNNFLDVHPRHFVPDPERENIFQRWMADSGIERDRHIARVIYDQLNAHGRGVITYGADHLNSLDPVLTQMFGKPGEYTQPVKQESVVKAGS